MSLFPAYFGARKRADEDLAPAPAPEPENESRADIFNLIPPRAESKYERLASELPDRPEIPAAPEKIEGRNVHPASAMDLTRLSIDNDGRLYWDGKPVEVRRRLMMSRGQLIGSSVVAFFIVAGAIGSAIQATATMHEWACRAGWASECSAALTPPPPPRPAARPDIPS